MEDDKLDIASDIVFLFNIIPGARTQRENFFMFNIFARMGLTPDEMEEAITKSLTKFESAIEQRG